MTFRPGERRVMGCRQEAEKEEVASVSFVRKLVTKGGLSFQTDEARALE
jgi:hypothetical protein